ncbi:hypothetical protein BDN72DRAFT_857768 [Pluteus cervinus]|uniref:Uncharacterized protein n=1 Tax=Pluteus cervinus TaxID=181527 RepID=A0ACD3AVJ3_9AGAR|nr:hypothetical protein BDN72DRAFT_857768 [Pluteus cervinus]
MSIEIIRPQISPRFHSDTADVIFLSSDRVKFHIHRKNLESTTAAFPGPEFRLTQGEIVPLTESAGTLELLFQFSYPQRQPELTKVGFEKIVPLAEAVEKYEVFPAMPACYRMMEMHIRTNPAEVFAYAGKHGYNDLADEAAPLLIGKPLNQMFKLLPPALALPWVSYREQWLQVLQAAYAKPVGYHSNCGAWRILMTNIMQKLSMQLGSLSDVKQIFAPPGANTRNCCSSYLVAWQQSVEENIKKIRKFSTFL